MINGPILFFKIDSLFSPTPFNLLIEENNLKIVSGLFIIKLDKIEKTFIYLIYILTIY